MFACVTAGFATPGVMLGSGYRTAGPAFCGTGASISARTSGRAVGTGGAGFGRAQPATSTRIATAVVSFMLCPPGCFGTPDRCGLGRTVVPLRRASGQEACANRRTDDDASQGRRRGELLLLTVSAPSPYRGDR